MCRRYFEAKPWKAQAKAPALWRYDLAVDVRTRALDVHGRPT
jgi:hypothetical protein